MKYEGNFFRIVLDSMPNLVSIYTATGKLHYCNQAFCNYFLSGATDLEGITNHTIFTGRKKEMSLLSSHLTTKEALSQSLSHRFSTFNVTLSSFRDDKGVLYYIEVFYPLAGQLADKIPSPEMITGQEWGMITSDSAMSGIIETIHRISQFDSTILITGESGTGKSLLARHIHHTSRRASQPFVVINCATIPENLIESELFGYVSGAFTGAQHKGKPGMVEQADKGTLFLDEIGLLPLHLQTKFLQLIQDRTYTPVGGLKSRRSDIRIISATNLDLKEQIRLGNFREDLYYRMRVIEFFMPPLRERADAIEPMILHFLKLLNVQYQQKKEISREAIEWLKIRPWNGNVRELQYLVELLFVTTTEPMISAGDIPPLSENPQTNPLSGNEATMDFDKRIESLERDLIIQACTEFKSSYKVAEKLGISQTRASKLIRKYLPR